MSLKIECHLKWNAIKNGLSLQMDCHSKWIFTQIGMSLKLECNSNWNVTQIGMSLKLECHTNWNVTQIRIGGGALWAILGSHHMPTSCLTSLLRRLQTQTLPDVAAPIGQIHRFSKMAVTFEPLMVF